MLPVLLDVVKNEDALFSLSELDYYEFRMKNPVSIDGRRQFVVSFRPRMKVGYALNFWKDYNIIEPTESLEKAVLRGCLIMLVNGRAENFEMDLFLQQRSIAGYVTEAKG